MFGPAKQSFEKCFNYCAAATTGLTPLVAQGCVQPRLLASFAGHGVRSAGGRTPAHYQGPTHKPQRPLPESGRRTTCGANEAPIQTAQGQRVLSL